MGYIDLSDYDAKSEFVVEAMNHNGKFEVIGKALIDQNLLNDADLETIWDLANWSINGKEAQSVMEGSVYAGLPCYVSGMITYVVCNHNVGVVNDNIIVRKHYDTTTAYYIKSSRLHKGQTKDIWSFGSYDSIVNEYKANPFICGRIKM